MEFRITDNMRKRYGDKQENLAVIKCELYLQKYGRAPTAREFITIEDEINDTAEFIYKHIFLKRRKRVSA